MIAEILLLFLFVVVVDVGHVVFVNTRNLLLNRELLSALEDEKLTKHAGADLGQAQVLFS